MARRTVATYLEDPGNSSTLSAIDAWLADPSGESLRGFVVRLRSDFNYPFRDHTTLGDWFTRNRAELWPRQAETPHPPTDSGLTAFPTPTKSFIRGARDLAEISDSEDFIVTSAVNNCYADPGFLAALEQWRGCTGGKILVNPVRYKNPTDRDDGKREDEWWDESLVEYMLEQEIRPHPLLSVMTTKAQATSSNPLPPRIDGRTKDRSAVFGHPQLMMRTVATPQHRLPKVLYSSGAVTTKNYSDTLAGDMADFHHTLGGIHIQVRGDRFHLREITWDGECFMDLDKMYMESGVYDAPALTALITGDTHVGLHAPNVMRATYGPGGMVDTLQPKYVVLHDLLDARSVNHHDMDKRLSRAARARKGETSLEGEIDGVREWLEGLPDGPNYVVTRSNHDDMLDRWLQRGEKGVEPENAEMYHALCAEMLREEREGGEFPLALEVALKMRGSERDVRFLRLDESFREHGIEMGMHGHLGCNGGAGGLRALSRIGTRFVSAHGHGGLMIYQGGYMTGMNAVYRHGYNNGPSNWIQGNVGVHANGRRQQILIIGEHWRG